MNNIEEFRKIIERRLRYDWDEIQHEISLFFEKLIYMNIPDDAHPDCIKNLSKTREKLLNDFDLSKERLVDPLSLPQLYELLYFIKEANFDCFRRGWMTGSDYNHYNHAEHLRDDILPKIKPLVREVQRFKNRKFDELVITFDNKTSENKFLDYDFEKFRLLQYDAHLSIINRVAYDPQTFVLLPLLLRNLFENILHDIFSQALHHSHHDLFYFKKNRRIMNFQHFISLLDILRSSVFQSVIKKKISDDIIMWLHEIREKGNLSVHDVISNITTGFANEWKDKISLMLEALLISYDKLEGKNLSIPKDEVYTIKKKLGMIKENKGKVVKKEKKVSNDIEKDSEKLQQFFDKLRSMMEKLYKQKKGIGLIFVKRLLRSEELQEYFGIGIDEKEPLDDSTVYFLDGKYSLIPNSKTLVLLDPERKILTNNDLPHLQDKEVLEKLEVFNIDLINYVKDEYGVDIKLYI